MATIGQALTSPESGWQRIDETHTYIKKTGMTAFANVAGAWQGGGIWTNTNGASVSFTFYGTKIRWMFGTNTDGNQATSKAIVIDGVTYNFANINTPSIIAQCVLFEKTGLPLGFHTVSVTHTASNGLQTWGLDAVDIDDTGYMSMVGSLLTVPEVGWKRYDETEGLLQYSNDWSRVSYAGNYNSTYSTTSTVGGKLSFKFWGTKLRVIVPLVYGGSGNVAIKIDGVSESFNEVGSATTTLFQAVVYDKIGLALGAHQVEIINTDTNVYIDAIDIDDTGYLIAQVGSQLLVPESGWRRFDNTNSIGIKYEGAWSTDSANPAHYGPSEQLSTSVGSAVTIKFVGTKMRLIGSYWDSCSDDIAVYVDGVFHKKVSQYSPLNGRMYLGYEVLGLAKGVHEIKFVNNKTSFLSVDAIDIDDTGYLTAPVGSQLTVPEAGWQRYDDAHAAITYAGSGWGAVTGDANTYGGTGHYITLSGATSSSVNFNFYGSKLRLIDLYWSNRVGNVKVNIDGVDYSYNPNNTANMYKVIVFEKLDLLLGMHTVTITTSSTSGTFSIDAVDVDGYLSTQVGQRLAAPETGWQRIDNVDGRLTYSGTWVSGSNAGYYSGSDKSSNTAGSFVTFKFYGTKVRLLAAVATVGITNAPVEIDGVVDTNLFRNFAVSTQFQVLTYERTGLAPGIHTVKVSVPANASPASSYVGLDAIDIDSSGYLIASVGQVLTTPDQGWLRYDDNHAGIVYSADWARVSDGNNYNSTYVYTTTAGGKASFKFIGNKLRIIVPKSGNASANVTVKIDGVSESFNGTGTGTQILAYEKLGLPSGVHTVEIISNNAYTYLDAIDIDSTGSLLTPVGQVLSVPDANWKRYDDQNVSLFTLGSGWQVASDGSAYGGTYFNTSSGTGTVDFKFTGTRIRLITARNNTGSPDAKIEIDGTSYPFSVNASLSYQVISFEKLDLADGVHNVRVFAGSNQMWLDAVDVAANARVLHRDEVTDLRDLAVGKRIRASYKAPVSGVRGTFWGLGNENKSFIAPASSATPDGDFYLICVDIERWNGRKKLIADRNIQHSVSYNTLNTAGLVSGLTVDDQAIPVSASASSVSSGNNVGFAIDLLDSSAWASAAGDVAAAWLKVDLGSVTSLKAIQVKNSEQAIGATLNVTTSMMISVSTDDVIYTTVGQLTATTVRWLRLALSDPTNVRYIKLSNFASTNDNVVRIGEVRGIKQTNYEMTARLPSGGISATNFDNEWDGYLVGSNLRGTVTPGDNSVWNWSGIYSWSSTTSSVSSYRSLRGNASAATWDAGGGGTGGSATNVGYRPVFLIESLLMERYLINDNGTIKTVKNSAISSLGAAPATEDMFKVNGLNLGDITESIIAQLTSPSLLLWSDDPRAVVGKTLRLTYAPTPTIVTPMGDIALTNVLQIDNVLVTSTTSGGGKLRIITSVDSGLTWKSYFDGAWQTVDLSNLSSIAANGMTPAALNALTSTQWSTLAETFSKIRFGYYLEINDPTDKAEIDAISIQVDMKGVWRAAAHGIAFDYEFGNESLRVFLYANGDYKINY